MNKQNSIGVTLHSEDYAKLKRLAAAANLSEQMYLAGIVKQGLPALLREPKGSQTPSDTTTVVMIRLADYIFRDFEELKARTGKTLASLARQMFAKATKKEPKL
jgi:hypothetical protein